MRTTTVRRALTTLAVAAAAALVPAGVAQAENHGPATAANAAATAHPMIGPACGVGKLCVFDGPNFTGHRHDFYACGAPADVARFGLTGVRSFLNNQTGNTVATFSHVPAAGAAPVTDLRSISVDAQSNVTLGAHELVRAC